MIKRRGGETRNNHQLKSENEKDFLHHHEVKKEKPQHDRSHTLKIPPTTTKEQQNGSHFKINQTKKSHIE